MTKITIPNETSLPEAARQLREAMGARRIFSFNGPMGAGKTTLIAALCRELGMVDEASSPTFSIVNEYTDADGAETVYHFDFYRLEHPEDALEIGVEDYFDSGHICLMEWAENIGNLLPEDTVEVTITPREDGSRLVTIEQETI